MKQRTYAAMVEISRILLAGGFLGMCALAIIIVMPWIFVIAFDAFMSGGKPSYVEVVGAFVLSQAAMAVVFVCLVLLFKYWTQDQFTFARSVSFQALAFAILYGMAGANLVVDHLGRPSGHIVPSNRTVLFLNCITGLSWVLLMRLHLLREKRRKRNITGGTLS